MGDAGCKHTDGGHLVGVDQLRLGIPDLFLQPYLLGDVPDVAMNYVLLAKAQNLAADCDHNPGAVPADTLSPVKLEGCALISQWNGINQGSEIFPGYQLKGGKGQHPGAVVAEEFQCRRLTSMSSKLSSLIKRIASLFWTNSW